MVFVELETEKTHEHRVPRWTEHTLEGRNLLSSPSVVSLLNECKVDFDENLKLLLDVDFYHRIRMNHGLPHAIPDVLVANRDHDDRMILLHQTMIAWLNIQRVDG